MPKTTEALGLWNMGEGRFHRRLSSIEAKRIIRSAFRCGITTFDSAYSYLDADTLLYSAMKEAGAGREEWKIIEKIMPLPSFERKANAALKRLHTSYFDALIIHWPGEEEGLWKTLKTLERIKNDGRAKETGVSNFPLALLRKTASDFPITLHERPLSLVWNRDYEEERKTGNIKTLAYAPLGMGILTSPKPLLSSLPFSSSTVLKELYTALDDMAGKKGVTRIDVALEWVYDQDPFIMIRGVSDERQLGWKRVKLSDEENRKLTALADRITAETESDNIFSHRWKEERHEEA